MVTSKACCLSSTSKESSLSTHCLACRYSSSRPMSKIKSRQSMMKLHGKEHGQRDLLCSIWQQYLIETGLLADGVRRDVGATFGDGMVVVFAPRISLIRVPGVLFCVRRRAQLEAKRVEQFCRRTWNASTIASRFSRSATRWASLELSKVWTEKSPACRF